MKETATVGIIGQTYENRVNQKIGVLESREEKFKTLLMRDENGNSFNVSYSTFKSSWRKYTGDKIINTSSQVESAREEVEHEQEVKEQAETKAVEKTVEKSKVSHTKKKADPEENMRLNQHISKILNDLVAGSVIRVAPGSKGCISLCIGNRRVVEFWPKATNGAFTLCLRQDFFNASKADKFTVDKVLSAKFHASWKLKYATGKIPVELLDKVAEEITKSLIEFQQINSTTDNKKKKKKED